MPKNAVKRRQKFTLENFELAEKEADDEVKPAEETKKEKKKKEAELSKKIQKKNEVDISSKRVFEQQKHVFTAFYTPNYPVTEEDLETLTDTEKALKSYQHKDSIDFMTATWKWMDKVASPMDALPRGTGNVPTYSHTSGVHAFYTVIFESPKKYILMACHQNTHGSHRGDLRFVQVDDRTTTRGIVDESVVGRLFLGDIVAVTELRRLDESGEFQPPNTSSVIFDEGMKCHWLAHSLSILPRTLKSNVKFAILENGTAVVNGHGEPINVKLDPMIPLDQDTVYMGDVFIPLKIDTNYTSDHHSNDLNRMISISAAFPQVKPPYGTVYQYNVSGIHTDMFDAGTDAFKNPKTIHTAEETVEFCALIGYYAAKTVFESHDDHRKFVMHDAKRDGNLVRFSIDNPKEHPTDGFWHSNGRIRFTSKTSKRNSKEGVNAMVETLLCVGNRLKIVARLSRDAPDDLDFKGLFTVQQRAPFNNPLIEEGFFQKLFPESNGKRIIRTLYGGPKLEIRDSPTKNQYLFPATPSIQLNEFQCEYVQKVLDGVPIVIANSPFGCGKSMTIVTAALYLYEKEKTRNSGKSQQLLVTQSNYASVNLVDIALKTVSRVKNVKFLRYVSESNWKEMPDACRSELDMPKLMNDVFIDWATHLNPSIAHSKYPALKESVMAQIVCYVMKTLGLGMHRLNPLARSVAVEASRLRFPPYGRKLLEPFFQLYQPDIIIVTASSLAGLLNSTFISKDNIRNVQIDEASQLAEYTLLSLLTLLPDSKFGLIGDIQQLPPYCEEELTGKLKDYGIGNAMERAVKERMFPQVTLKSVYRCHPVTTQLLGELFYNNELITGVSSQDRSEFMKNRPHFWPNPEFPIMIVDNKSKAQSMGTSFANEHERLIVKQIIEFLTDSARKKYVISPADIGVISYYSAQTSLLTDALRNIGVKCGTVDSFQGSEREIIVLCCTNDDIQEFMQVKNRLNVAMSRSKQVTILVGNVEMLKKVQYWSTIIERCEQNGCVVDTNKYPFKVTPAGGAAKKTVSKPRENKELSDLAKEFKDILSFGDHNLQIL
ncbi:hypothetical protein CAEBREN_08456 [Caenorhabditis brenneri]|uniref:DNA2/NAM7 helicase-like C-terminal domain-containing protein n=1 Tax=Caenorhabditis brenneri TaxID=135651 RepID=G0NQT1_CAEBE|nr:hypothetical protein CAEBREN_08456 [Caenorhabditis brenneri]